MTSDAPHNPAAEEPRRAGLIADERSTDNFVELLQASKRWTLAAASGACLEDACGDAQWCDDRRVMMAQSGVEAVFLETSTRNAVEITELAAPHHLAIWRKPPVARNFAEAIGVAQLVEEHKLIYRVATWWEHVRETVREAMRQIPDFKPRFTEIHVRNIGPSVQSWRAGVVDAGGGVLTLDAYGMLEGLVALRGLPDNVFAATGRFRKHPGEAPRESEDVACVILRYEGGGVAQILATWDLPGHACYTRHHGDEHTIEFTASEVRVLDRGGAIEWSAELPTNIALRETERFADMMTDEEAAKDVTRVIDRHIAVTSLLEAIYLSAQTWHPEAPRKFYEVQQWKEHRV